MDDHPLFRTGVSKALESEPGFQVCCEAASIREARRELARLSVDVAILDISLPDGSGLDLLRWIRQQSYDTRVLMLSVHYSSAFVQAAFRYGALGYITKGAPASELHTAVRIVADGRVYAGSEAAAALTDTGQIATPDPAESLTPREREVAIFLTRGHTTAEAARELGVSPKTVEAHRASIFRKLEVRNAVQLTRLFVRNDTPVMN